MPIRRTALKFTVAIALVAFLPFQSAFSLRAEPNWPAKLDPLLLKQGTGPGRSAVVLRVSTSAVLPDIASQVRAYGGRVGRSLPIINGVALDVPNAMLPALASNTAVERISADRPVGGANERTSATVGASEVRQQLGYDGTGIGVAVIDSGAAAAHDDLREIGTDNQRVDGFVDFVNGQSAAYDDYGHGTHVAGTIAGDGYDAGGAQAGIAPGVRLFVLKVLDQNGRGHMSDVIAALDYVVTHKDEFHIRVVNLSVATGVYESYNTDPLTLAAKQAVSAGLVVVAAAGNNGRDSLGSPQYAGVTAPGNAPWVLTVGASSHMGTPDRADDTMAAFSSRGPGAIDYRAKPDLVAPGVGTESLTDPSSALYVSPTAALISGTVPTAYFPYMSLSGTSMSAPVVTGTVALMLQANPSLTPNAVKGILQYTAQQYAGYDALTQGAGFLNAKGAVELAAYLAAPSTTPYPATDSWSSHIIWGNHLEEGGRITGDASAWAFDVTWGDGLTASGERVRWGVTCTTTTCDDVSPQPWQTSCLDLACSVVNGDSALSPNVVWGQLCDGADCSIPWAASSVTATSDPEADIVVWGTSDGEQDIVVWGTSCSDPACEPVVWKRE